MCCKPHCNSHEIFFFFFFILFLCISRAVPSPNWKILKFTFFALVWTTKSKKKIDWWCRFVFWWWCVLLSLSLSDDVYVCVCVWTHIVMIHWMVTRMKFQMKKVLRDLLLKKRFTGFYCCARYNSWETFLWVWCILCVLLCNMQTANYPKIYERI